MTLEILGLILFERLRVQDLIALVDPLRDSLVRLVPWLRHQLIDLPVRKLHSLALLELGPETLRERALSESLDGELPDRRLRLEHDDVDGVVGDRARRALAPLFALEPSGGKRHRPGCPWGLIDQ